MQIVVNIEDEFYDYIKEQVKDGITNPLKVAIVNGKILPKGHGKLIDADELFLDIQTDEQMRLGEHLAWVRKRIEDAPTIIEADAPKRRKGMPLEENDSCYNCENWIP